MADAGRAPKAARPRKAPTPRGLTADEFTSAPEFAHFKAVMRRLVAVPKTEADKMVKAARGQSPRIGNPAAPGRKPTRKRR
jgi:hypothetical protein